MAGRRSPHDGDQTRLALLDAAEQLFAEEGVEATSIRAVNKSAGVAPAAVHYHFRSKEGLVEAVLARRGEHIIEHIIERADALAARRRRPRAREIIECVALPYLELLEAEPLAGRRWLGIVAQLSLAQDERLDLGDPASERLRSLCAVAYPKVPETDVAPRLTLALNALLQMLGRAPSGSADVDGSALDQILVEFVAGGLDSTLRSAAQDAEPASRSA